MPPMMKLESIATEPPIEIIQADSGYFSLGREPENHIVIDSTAVSRCHGYLIGVGNRWVYRDAESTNGSWISGIRLASGQIKLLRDGEILQLADFCMRFSEVSWPGQIKSSSISVLVFYKGEFEGEFRFNELEGIKKFAIGGDNAQFYLEGFSGDIELLQIQFGKQGLESFTDGTKEKVLVNNVVAVGAIALRDKDEVVLGPYKVIVCDDSSASVPVVESFSAAQSMPKVDKNVKAYERPNLPEHLKKSSIENDQWQSEAAKRKEYAAKKFVFGSEPSPNETTGTLGLARFDIASGSGYEMSTSQRFSRAVLEADSNVNSPLTETILLVLGVFFFAVIIAVIGFYLFLM